MNDTLFNRSAPNSSSKSKADYLNNLIIVIHSLICVLGVLGNGLVIYVTGFKMKKTVNTVWFLNLAVADLLFTFFLIFGIIPLSRNFDWPFGDFMCKFVHMVVMLNMFASIFLLTAISLDRCLSTWVVAWVQNKRTLLKARASCFFIWMLSILCSLPFCIYRKTEFKASTQRTKCIQNYPKNITFKSLVIFRFVVGFLIPFVIITISYVAIGIRARRLACHRRKKKPFKLILAVILAFFICWLPFHIYMFADVWIREMKQRNKKAKLNDLKVWLDTVGLFVSSLSFFNSCLNPFLYVFVCDEFKKKLKQSLVAVFESAFAEEHLTFLLPQFSLNLHQSKNTDGEKEAQQSAVSFSDKERSNNEQNLSYTHEENQSD